MAMLLLGRLAPPLELVFYGFGNNPFCGFVNFKRSWLWVCCLDYAPNVLQSFSREQIRIALVLNHTIAIGFLFCSGCSIHESLQNYAAGMAIVMPLSPTSASAVSSAMLPTHISFAPEI